MQENEGRASEPYPRSHFENFTNNIHNNYTVFNNGFNQFQNMNLNMPNNNLNSIDNNMINNGYHNMDMKNNRFREAWLF